MKVQLYPLISTDIM